MGRTADRNIWVTLIQLLGLVLVTQYARMGVSYLFESAPQHDMVRFLRATLHHVVPVALVILYAKYGERRSIRSLGFTTAGGVKSYLQGALLGVLFVAVVTVLALLFGEIDYRGINHTFSFAPFVAALLLAVINIREEVLFRGWLMTSAGGVNSPVQTVIGGSILFGLIHCGNHHVTLLSIINLMLFSIFLSELFLIVRNVWIVAAFHSMWNFAQGKIAGLPVSGNPAKNALLDFGVAPDSLTEGFGLEGNLFTTVVLCAAIAWATKKVSGRVPKREPVR